MRPAALPRREGPFLRSLSSLLALRPYSQFLTLVPFPSSSLAPGDFLGDARAVIVAWNKIPPALDFIPLPLVPLSLPLTLLLPFFLPISLLYPLARICREIFTVFQ